MGYRAANDIHIDGEIIERGETVKESDLKTKKLSGKDNLALLRGYGVVLTDEEYAIAFPEEAADNAARADELLKQAEEASQKIVAEARAEAEKILQEARDKADSGKEKDTGATSQDGGSKDSPKK